jgi:uncharacterized protein YecE (DUF72 family)
MQIFVGTSGWSYSWNEGGNFDWFVQNSNLNAIELNASFYRFPFPSHIKSWSKKGKNLRWAIKVNKIITHVFKFSEKAYDTWIKFKNLFKELDDIIDFYLFQTPPNFSDKNKDKIEKFIEFTNLKERFALEVREDSWFKKENYKWAKNLNITWVSMDSPSFPRDIINLNGIVYLRMHGRTDWYSHYYYDEELREVAEKIFKTEPLKVYVFFNNDHAMLENAQRMKRILESLF